MVKRRVPTGRLNGSKATPTTPANVNNLIGIDAKKVRVEKGQRKKANLGESTEERWVFAVEVRNKSRANLEGIRIKVWQGERKVAEFKSNDAAVKKAKWPDDEPAVPE
jgi:hypothetical protein